MRPFLHANAGHLRLLAVMLGAGVVVGLAFASWMDKAPGIFMALVESGMSWCF